MRWNLVVVADSPPSVKTAENLRTDVGLSLLFSFQRTGSLVSPGITGLGERPQIVAGAPGRVKPAIFEIEGSGPAPKSWCRCGCEAGTGFFNEAGSRFSRRTGWATWRARIGPDL